VQISRRATFESTVIHWSIGLRTQRRFSLLSSKPQYLRILLDLTGICADDVNIMPHGNGSGEIVLVIQHSVGDKHFFKGVLGDVWTPAHARLHMVPNFRNLVGSIRSMHQPSNVLSLCAAGFRVLGLRLLKQTPCEIRVAALLLQVKEVCAFWSGVQLCDLNFIIQIPPVPHFQGFKASTIH